MPARESLTTSVDLDVPKMFEHTLAVYKELWKMRVKGSKPATFKGSKVAAFRSVGVSQTYYTPIYRTLEEMGCIEQIQKGTSGVPSIVVLHKTPSLEEFQNSYRRVLTKPSPLDTIRQVVSNLEGRLAEAEARLDKLEQGGKEWQSADEVEVET